MALINPRDVQNKPGYSFDAGSLTRIYAEDYQVIKDTLRSAGSEIFPWVYNVTTVQRDALSVSGSGFVIFNTTVGSLQVYNGSSWGALGGTGGVTAHSSLTGLTNDDHTQYLLVNGTRTGSNIIVSGSIVAGSFIGSSSNYLPQGVLPVGSIPTLTTYIPQGQLITGSLPNTINISGSVIAPFGSYSSKVIAGSFIGDGSGLTSLPLSGYLPQGVIPAGSLTNALPQGQVPVGSLSAVLPQGQLPTGSLPNTITVSGSVVALYGSFANTVVAGSFVGYGGNLTGLSSGGLPQGELPIGSIPNLTSLYLPQGQLPTGSLPNNIVISGSVYAAEFGAGIASPVSPIHIYQNNTEVGAGGGLTIEQDGTGDAIVQYLLTGATRWVTGVDNSDSDKYKISSDLDLADSSYFEITTTGSIGFPTASASQRLTVTGAGSFSGVVTAGSFVGDGSGLTSLPLSGYLPQGVLPVGSLTNALPQGQVPVGSLSAVIPQGVLPIGSVPTLTSLYIPQGQLISGSLPTNPSITGSVSITGSGIVINGSVSIFHNASTQSIDFIVI